MMLTPRMWAAGTLVVLLALVAVFAAMTIPWHRPPAPRADQLAALGQLPADKVTRAREFHAELRPGSYSAMAISLACALVLGLTPLGSWLVTQAGRPFGGNWVAQAVLGGLAVVLAVEGGTLPLAAWRHTLVGRYGISTPTRGAGAGDGREAYAGGAGVG